MHYLEFNFKIIIICSFLEKIESLSSTYTYNVSYRPIAMMSSFSKVFGMVLSDAQVLSKLSTSQDEFVRGRSTTTNLCETLQFI